MDFTSQTMAIKKFKVKFFMRFIKDFSAKKFFLYFIHYLFVTFKLSVRFSIIFCRQYIINFKSQFILNTIYNYFLHGFYTFLQLIVQQVGLEDSVELHVLAV